MAAAGMAMTACGSATEKLTETAIEQGTGIDLDIDDGSFSVDTPSGRISVDTDDDGRASYSFEGEDTSGSYQVTGELPADWPDFVYVPDMHLYGSSHQESGDLERFGANGLSEGSMPEVVDDIVAAMGEPSSEATNAPSASLGYEENGFRIEYLIYESPQGTTVDISAIEETR